MQRIGRRIARRGRIFGLLIGLGTLIDAPATSAGHDHGVYASPQAPAAPAVRTLDDLARLGQAELLALYRQAPPATIPTGKVRGRPLLRPGSPLAVPISRAGRVVWQGKVFDPASGTAVNRFFGVRAIRGELAPGPSWLDGGPALILDYERTSRVYARYRDELREVAPGLLLGLMYDRTGPQAGPVRYFALAYSPAIR